MDMATNLKGKSRQQRRTSLKSSGLMLLVERKRMMAPRLSQHNLASEKNNLYFTVVGDNEDC